MTGRIIDGRPGSPAAGPAVEFEIRIRGTAGVPVAPESCQGAEISAEISGDPEAAEGDVDDVRWPPDGDLNSDPAE
jgi:hypothetical protein